MSAVLRSGASTSTSLPLVVLAAGALVFLGVACGDDDSTPTDAGVTKDAATMDAAVMHIPRKDASVATTDPIPLCDRNDPLGCGPGQVCTIVIRRAPKDTQFSVSTGCVEARRQRAAGDPCDTDYTNSVPYSAPGLLDEVYTDPCGAGLVCAPDRTVRGAATCQLACSSGALGDTPFGCQSSTALCLSAGSFTEFCRESERCDVAKQTGCRAGESCYLRPTGDGKAMLAVCRPTPAMPLADGAMCQPFYTCKPGSQCMGPVHIAPLRWQTGDFRCRPVCSVDGADVDAGSDADGGVRGSCKAGATCVAYTESGLNLSSIPKVPYGQCEP